MCESNVKKAQLWGKKLEQLRLRYRRLNLVVSSTSVFVYCRVAAICNRELKSQNSSCFMIQ